MPIILDEKNLSLLIKLNRKRAGLTQLELAELAGVEKTRAMVRKISIQGVQTLRIEAQFGNHRYFEFYSGRLKRVRRKFTTTYRHSVF